MKQQMEKQSMSKKKIKELENNFSKHFECSITYKKKNRKCRALIFMFLLDVKEFISCFHHCFYVFFW